MLKDANGNPYCSVKVRCTRGIIIANQIWTNFYKSTLATNKRIYTHTFHVITYRVHLIHCPCHLYVLHSKPRKKKKLLFLIFFTNFFFIFCWTKFFSRWQPKAERQRNWTKRWLHTLYKLFNVYPCLLFFLITWITIPFAFISLYT